MRHTQYNTTYPMGAFIYDPKNQINIFGANLELNHPTQITRDDLLIELIGMEIWMEHKKIINKNGKNNQVDYVKKILDSNKKYDFYISDQKMGSIDGICDINFHSIVNRIIVPNTTQFTKFNQSIDWLVIPLFGNIERYIPSIYNVPKNTFISHDDCMKGSKKQQPVRMTDRRREMNNLIHRSQMISNTKYVRNKEHYNLKNASDHFEQDIWIREIDGTMRFGPETTGKVTAHSLFNMLYFISIVRVIGWDTISITIHRINPIKYEI